MSLKEYNKKRNFDETPEPHNLVSSKHKNLIFVVQKHDASHLHYDFRLEADGVLKSWAVPKGPSLNPADKRLAVMVEDHPIGYADFEGIIPEGNYGAGTVEIWDNGTWIPDDKHADVEKALENGELIFTLKGKKLKGKFSLINMKKSTVKNGWLLIKKNDEYAVNDEYDSTTIK